MKQVQLKNATAFEYTKKDEIIGILKERYDLDEIKINDPRMVSEINKIKKVVLIRHDHSGYKPAPLILTTWKDKDGSQFNYYTNGICWVSSIRPEIFVQEACLEYYNLKRDDDRMEEMLKHIKPGTKLHYFDKKFVMHEATVLNAEMNCEEEFILKIEIGKATVLAARITADKTIESYNFLPLYLTRETAENACRQAIQQEINQHLKCINQHKAQILELKKKTHSL